MLMRALSFRNWDVIEATLRKKEYSWTKIASLLKKLMSSIHLVDDSIDFLRKNRKVQRGAFLNYIFEHKYIISISKL